MIFLGKTGYIEEIALNKKKCRGICFTENGIKILCKLKEFLEIETYVKKESINTNIQMDHIKVNESLEEWTKDAFECSEAIIFVGAVGIAVRAISPFVSSKLSDPAVIVIDELGNFVIPLLSGHVGGANKLARTIGDRIGAAPIITTATDINGVFAIDEYACQHDLEIINKDGIKKVSQKVLEQKSITIAVKDYPLSQPVDVLIGDAFSETDILNSELRLSPHKYVLGIGCKRGKSYEEIVEVIKQASLIYIHNIVAVASIDVKENEPGIVELAKRLGVPFVTFSSEMLEQVEEKFDSSEFVKRTVGVGNVCESAAFLAAGVNSEIVVPKFAKNGVTVAVARI